MPPRSRKYGRKVPTPVADATEKAIAAADLGPRDAGAVEVLRALAVKIDMTDRYMELLARDAEEKDLRPPSQDNVSIPTYLKFCESLGLTPAGRARQEPKGKPADKEDAGGKLAKLRSINGGRIQA